MNWEIKHSWGSGCTVSLSIGLGGPVGKAYEKFTLFSLKLVWYSHLQTLKLELSVSNKKNLFFCFFLGHEGSKTLWNNNVKSVELNTLQTPTTPLCYDCNKLLASLYDE